MRKRQATYPDFPPTIAPHNPILAARGTCLGEPRGLPAIREVTRQPPQSHGMLPPCMSCADSGPSLLLLAAIAAAWASGLTQQLSWATLARNQAALIAWVASHPVIAPSLYSADLRRRGPALAAGSGGGDGGGRAAVRHPVRRHPGGRWDRRPAPSRCSSPSATTWRTPSPRAAAGSSTPSARACDATGSAICSPSVWCRPSRSGW